MKVFRAERARRQEQLWQLRQLLSGKIFEVPSQRGDVERVKLGSTIPSDAFFDDYFEAVSFSMSTFYPDEESKVFRIDDCVAIYVTIDIDDLDYLSQNPVCDNIYFVRENNCLWIKCKSVGECVLGGV